MDRSIRHIPTRISSTPGRRNPVSGSPVRSASARLRGWLVAGLAALAVGCLAGAPVTAQEVKLAGLGGGELAESDLQKGPVIVVVWASWPPRCRNIVDRANAIDARWSGEARVITVNYQETRSEVQSFLSGKSLRPEVFLDTEGEFSKKYSRPNLPVLVVFRGGEAVLKTALPDDPDAAIAKALG